MPENSSKKEILAATKATLENSTLHAVSNIAQAKYNSVKILWTVGFLLSATACGWYLVQSISAYYKYETVTNLQVNTVKQLIFPIVSVCNDEGNRNGSIKGLTRKKVEFFFLSKDLDNNNDIEIYNDTEFGTCFRFNSGGSLNGNKVSFKYVNDRGWRNSLYLRIHHNVRPIIWITNEITDSNLTEGIYIWPKSYNSIKLRLTKIIKQPKPFSSCLDDLTSVDSYDSECYKKTFIAYNSSYNYNYCINMCNQKYIGQKCKFQLFGPKYFEELRYKHLNYTDWKCIDSNQLPAEFLNDCDCPFKCKTTEFTYTHSFTSYGFKMTDIYIFYDEMKETVILEQAKILLSDLISNIGGVVGLFSGFSFLSLVEIFEIFFQIVIIRCKNIKKCKSKPNKFNESNMISNVTSYVTNV